MPRYILIDAHSGYVFGDTADIGGRAVHPGDILEAARILDTEVVRVDDRAYQEVPRQELAGRTGYLVYRADIDGSEAIPVVEDGQDRETIEAVRRLCRYEGAVLCTQREDALTDAW